MYSSKPNFDADELFTSAPRVTVKFKLSQDKIFTLPFTIETSTHTIKEQLAYMLQIPITDLNLSKDSMIVKDMETLADFATAKCGTIVMNLHTSHYIDLNALSKQIYGDVAMRDVISVTVDMGEGKEPQHILVEIIKENLEKAFIGGYRHRLNGKEYHHVYSQTTLTPKRDIVKYERDTQTALYVASKLEGTNGIKSTQTPVKGLHLIEPHNTNLTARKYITTKENKEKGLVLQKYWRRWVLRAKIKSDKFGMQDLMEDREKKFKDDDKMKVMFQIKSFLPNERGEIYQSNAEKGNNEEVSKIFTGTMKMYYGKFLLTQEIEKLLIREQEKKYTLNVLQEKHNLNLIKKYCEPLTWIGKQGHAISVEKEHHRELSSWYEIYKRYSSDELLMKERRSLIIEMQEKLEKTEGWYNLKVQDLLTEQLDLLNIGVDSKFLSLLQKVTEKYLLAYLEDYASKYSSKMEDDSVLRCKLKVFDCKYCKRVKPDSSFRSRSKINGANVCKSCFWLENMSRRRVDYAVYRSILLSIRREEEKRNCLYSVAFVVQEEDIHYIVNTIWHGKSILSETKEVSCLRLCRFDTAIAWSPWNCFLITEKEMRAHLLVENPIEVYGSWLFEQVRTKHLMARLHFRHLWKKTSKHAQNKDWQNIRRSHNVRNVSFALPKI